MKRSRLTMARQVDDETVILDLSSGRYFALNTVGTFIWDRLENECSEEELVDAVVERFEIDRVNAAKDAAELIQQLYDRDLLER